MEQSTTKPLYKVLNEKRTQGNWEHDLERNSARAKIYTGEGMGEFTIHQLAGNATTEEVKANAQYTTLAVNNLHILAEALEKAISNPEHMGKCKFSYDLSQRFRVSASIQEQADWYKINILDPLEAIS